MPGRLALAAVLFTASASQAQSTDPPVSYVASIRQNKAEDARSISEYSPGGRFAAVAITVGALLRIAYRLQPYQLMGLPDWISTIRYDITARIDDSPAPQQQVFLRALLKDRFKLAVHNDTRESAVFSLVLARSDGRLGRQLMKSSFDCAAFFAGPRQPPDPGRAPNCGTRILMGSLSGKAISMAQLASSLSPFAGRFAIDKTGLSGGFDVELTWTPDQMSSGGPPPDAGPSIFAALQEQLGLKLISDRGPVAVLVVDHIEEPSAN